MYDERALYRQQKRLAPGNHLEFFLGDDGRAYMLRFAMTHDLRDYRHYLDLIQWALGQPGSRAHAYLPRRCSAPMHSAPR